MSVKYVVHEFKDIKLTGEDICVIIPTDEKARIFPDKLKKAAPQSYQMFRKYSQETKLNPAESLLIGLHLSEVGLIFPLCIKNNKIDYAKMFKALTICSEQYNTIYILQEFSENYLSSFEAFEYDIEDEFKDSDVNVVIVNKIPEPINYDNGNN